MKRLTWLAVGVLCALGLAAIVSQPGLSRAADHNDPPERSGDSAADIGDFYAWHKEDGNMVVVVTFDGNKTPEADQAGNYDSDVLYGVHFSNVGSGGTPQYMSTHDIWIRFGQDSAGNWGIQVTNMPGETDPVEGAVETALNGASGDTTAWVGLADDPFFFDLEGFMDTVTTGDLSFASLGGDPRDTLMGRNATAIVLEFPAAEVTNAGGMVHTWATTGRVE